MTSFALHAVSLFGVRTKKSARARLLPPAALFTARKATATAIRRSASARVGSMSAGMRNSALALAMLGFVVIKIHRLLRRFPHD